MPADAQQNRDEYQELFGRAEALLADAWGGAVRLGGFDTLSEPRGRNLVLRCAIRRAPAGVPSTVILKRARQRNYDPDDPTSRPAVGLFRDWAGLKFLDSFRDEQLACAKFYGGDREAGFFVMEDLRDTIDLDHLLTRCSADEARQGLRLLAAALGRMHAVTIQHAERYQQIRDALGPGDSAHRHRLAKHARDYVPYLAERCEALQVKLAPGYEADIEAIAAAMADPGEFLAFTHCDACPDNCRIADDRLRLIDFEFASYRHALLDGVYGWIRFPTCWCVRDLPQSVVWEMEQVYRRELAERCPAAEDDALYFRAVAEACGYWLLENMAQLFDRALKYETPKGTSTDRQRILKRIDAFCHVTQRAGHLDALRQTFAGLLDRLRMMWRDNMPLYDAFGQAEPVSAAEVLEVVGAVRANDLPRVRRLLDAHRGLANAKAPDDDQTPLLYLAMETGNHELVKLLLDRGGDWRRTTRSGWTILSRACSHGTPQIVDLLLEQGADLNQRDMWGLLPIYGVVEGGNAEMLKHLLARGARPDLKMAIDLKQPDYARKLLEQDASRARMRFGTGLTLLHDSARVGDSRLATLQRLLEFGARVDVRTNWGATPLHLAAFHGNEKTVQLLLENGADPRAEDKRGRTPLMLAEGRGHTTCAELLSADSPGDPEGREVRPVSAASEHADLFDDVFASYEQGGGEDPHPLDELDLDFGTWTDDG